ncbi:amino acid permease [Salmonella enterica subsp. enterica serovar Typhi]|nr:amino acid permease [Salmonella enterica subsp. enterica serovar Typhi]
MEKKLGLSALTALVLSSMLGAGVFSLPQNMAAVASPAALLIGWAITGVGILLLAFAMLILTRIRSELDGGIFTYAREGFGELIGFCSAWGYWLCAVIANVSYLVIVFSALSFFTDTPALRLFGDGNTFASLGYISEENAAPLHFSHPSGSVADGHGTGTPTGSAEPSPKPTFLCRPYDVIKRNVTGAGFSCADNTGT